MTIRVAAIQPLPIDTLQDPRNVQHALELLERAAKLEADIACFPELYPYGGLKDLKRKARELGIYVVAGIAEESGDGHPYNTAFVIDDKGEVIGKQRKVHIVKLVEKFKSGDTYDLIRTPLGNLGVLICIDFWGFPDGSYALAEKGADLIINPCLIFRKKVQKRMTCLVRVLEYGIPILSVNNAKWSLKLGDEEVCESCDVGSFPPEGGGSIIVSPPLFKSIGDVEDWFRVGRSCEEWIIKEAGDGEEILVAELDLKGIRRARQLWSDYFS